MTSGPWRNLRTFATEGVKILPKRRYVFRGVIIERLVVFLGLGNDAIINISEVHHLHHPVALEFQITANDVDGNRGTKISNVAIVPYRRAAVIHSDFAVVERTEFFQLT